MSDTKSTDDCFEDSGIPIKLERLVEGKKGAVVMYLSQETATGELKNGRKFTVSSNVAGGDLIFEFEKTKKEEKASPGGLSKDRFVIRMKPVMDAIVEHIGEQSG